MSPAAVPSMAHAMELSLRRLGPFYARFKMKNGEIWVGEISKISRDEQDTWLVLEELIVSPYGNGREVRLRASQVKECLYYGEDNAWP